MRNKNSIDRHTVLDGWVERRLMQQVKHIVCRHEARFGDSASTAWNRCAAYIRLRVTLHTRLAVEDRTEPVSRAKDCFELSATDDPRLPLRSGCFFNQRAEAAQARCWARLRWRRVIASGESSMR